MCSASSLSRSTGNFCTSSLCKLVEFKRNWDSRDIRQYLSSHVQISTFVPLPYPLCIGDIYIDTKRERERVRHTGTFFLPDGWFFYLVTEGWNDDIISHMRI